MGFSMAVKGFRLFERLKSSFHAGPSGFIHHGMQEVRGYFGLEYLSAKIGPDFVP